MAEFTTVWSSYGVAAVILIGLLAVSLRQAAQRKAALKNLEAEHGRSRRT